MVFQQLSGINAVIFFMSTIFESAGDAALSPAESTIGRLHKKYSANNVLVNNL